MFSLLSFRNTVLLSIATFAFACGDNGNGAKTPDAKTPPGTADAAPMIDATPPPDAGPPADVSMVTTQAAAAVCKALFRCCDNDLAVYFNTYKNDTRLPTALKDRLPPADEAACNTVLKEMMDLFPFGDWLAAVNRGAVEFVPTAFSACIADLDNSTCGASSRDALFDSTCFFKNPPAGGEEQRKIFSRNAQIGDSCKAIRDGSGALFYGECDPTKAFCCRDTGGGKCGAAISAAGVCQAVVSVGETCSSNLNNLLLCATGNFCSDANLCVPELPTLQLGATCADSAANLIGYCDNSYCDRAGTKACATLKADGAVCLGGEFQCMSSICTPNDPMMASGPGVCSPNNVCTGQ